jgi:subtilase family protein
MRDATRCVLAVAVAAAHLVTAVPATAVINNFTFTPGAGDATATGQIVFQPGPAQGQITEQQFSQSGFGGGIHYYDEKITTSENSPGTSDYTRHFRDRCLHGRQMLTNWSTQFKPQVGFNWDTSWIQDYQAPAERLTQIGTDFFNSRYMTMPHLFSGSSPIVGQIANGRFTDDLLSTALRYAGEFGGFRVASGLQSSTFNYTGGAGCNTGSGAFDPSSANSIGVQLGTKWPCPDMCWLNNRELQFCAEMLQPAMRASAGSAPADMPSQWAFKKLGLPLTLPLAQMHAITVAVIDSGLDYRHPSVKPENLWMDRVPDDPRYPGARLGWNFVDGHNNPADDVGHGTFVTGVILSVNPKAKILPIKVVNRLGHARSLDILRAVVFAVERGARVINLSLGAQTRSVLTQEVVDYARRNGVLIVAAAGNEGVDVAGYVPSGTRGVLTVAPTDSDDKKPPFGNWGQNVAIAAPGVDVVSWRAAVTDFVLVATGGKDYKRGDNIVGNDGWLYRASGSSFAAPFVAGAASLILALRPNLTGAQLARMLVTSADDVEVPGWDQYTGSGRLNIVRSIFADPNYYLTVRVARVSAGTRGNQPVVEVRGTVDGNTLASYQVQLGQGDNPTSWKTLAAERGKSVADGLIAAFPVREITARGKWTVRVVAQDTDSRTREARGTLDVQ